MSDERLGSIALQGSSELVFSVGAWKGQSRASVRKFVTTGRYIGPTKSGLSLRGDVLLGIIEALEADVCRVLTPKFARGHRSRLLRRGSFYLGVEDDGSVTGLHPQHRDPAGLASMVANRTVLGNLLVVEPRPRNPSLADAIKRIGLAERTGRGIDLIYQGLLRYGRPPPDYGRSSAQSVVVVLPGGTADLDLLRIILDEEKRIGGRPVDYVRQAAFDSIQQEQMVLQFVEKHGQITRKEAASLCRLNEDQATYLLRKLREEHKLKLVGSGRGAFYRVP